MILGIKILAGSLACVAGLKTFNFCQAFPYMQAYNIPDIEKFPRMSLDPPCLSPEEQEKRRLAMRSILLKGDEIVDLNVEEGSYYIPLIGKPIFVPEGESIDLFTRLIAWKPTEPMYHIYRY